MGFMKKAGALGIAKMVYDQARRPENQARIKRAVDEVQRRRRGGAAGPGAPGAGPRPR